MPMTIKDIYRAATELLATFFLKVVHRVERDGCATANYELATWSPRNISLSLVMST
jgi:hypothetical protein